MNFNLYDAWLPGIKDFFSSSSLKLTLVADRFSKFFKYIAMYLAVAGMFSFSAFIMEESIQLLSFAQFSASDTRQYALMKENLDYMEEVNASLKFVNTYFLWMLPPQRIGYAHYSKATDLYMKTLKAEVLANDPEVYLGETVDLQFKYHSFKPAKNGLWVAQNKKVKIILKNSPETKTICVTGVVRPDPDMLGGVIITRQ